MAIDQIGNTLLEDATMLHEVFAESAAPALQRRIAWALDCAKIDEAMYWLQVYATLYGQPVDDPDPEASTGQRTDGAYLGPSA